MVDKAEIACSRWPKWDVVIMAKKITDRDVDFIYKRRRPLEFRCCFATIVDTAEM